MANLIINQAGLSAGVPDRSRSDGKGGFLVTLSHDAANAVFTSYELLWVPDDDNTALSSFTTVSNTATFTPDATSVGGTYRIRLRVTTATGTSESIRLFAVRTAHGIRIPALNEQANELASLQFNGAQAINDSEFNEPSASGPFAAGNYGGWYTAYSDLVKRVESLSSPAVDKSAPWQLLYAADLALVSNQNMDTPGVYTVLGATWWRKGAAATGQTFGSFNLGGLRSALTGAVDTQLPAGTATPAQGFFFLPFSQFPAFNPLAPVMVSFNAFTRFTGGATTRSFGGIVNAALSSASWNTRSSQMLLGHATGNAKGHMGADGVWRDVACGFTGDNVGLNHSIARIGDLAAMTHYYNGGGMQNPDQLGSGVSASANYIFSGTYKTAPTTQGFLFGNSSAGGQQTEATLSGISIYQPKA